MSTSTTSMIGFTGYLAGIRRISNLSKEEEWELAERAQQGDRAATHRLITSHLPLVVSVAKKYLKYGIPLEELVGEGNIALVACVKDFDPSRGRFATHARLYIRTALRMYVLANHSMVAVSPSTYHKRAFFGLLPAKAAVAGNQAHEPSVQQITQMASLLRVPPSIVVTMDGRLRGDLSLNQPLSDEHTGEWQDTLPAEDNPELHAIARIDKEKIQALLTQTINTLPPRARAVFLARTKDPPVAYNVLCDTYGLTAQELTHLAARTMKKVKQQVTAALAT